MTDTKPNADDLFPTETIVGEDKPTDKPERGPDLTEVEPEDGFDEEYVFQPTPAPLSPDHEPEPESQDLAEDIDWDLPIDPLAHDEQQGRKQAKPASAPTDGSHAPTDATTPPPSIGGDETIAAVARPSSA